MDQLKALLVEREGVGASRKLPYASPPTHHLGVIQLILIFCPTCLGMERMICFAMAYHEM